MRHKLAASSQQAAQHQGTQIRTPPCKSLTCREKTRIFVPGSNLLMRSALAAAAAGVGGKEHLGQEDKAGHVVAAGLYGAVHERRQPHGEAAADCARGLHGGHAQLGFAVRQPRRRQPQRPLVHRLPDQLQVDLRRVLAHLHTQTATFIVSACTAPPALEREE